MTNVPRAWIVVPDGLAADEAGRAIPEPSFVYRLVLEWTARQANRDDVIYLAPANYFGGSTTEQEAGRMCLAQLTQASVFVGHSPGNGYINTRGNATLLRQQLQEAGQWPLASPYLVAYHLHLRRAVETFAQEGFAIARACPVTGTVDRTHPGSRIVRRLWYYRYPAAHRVYEAIALALTRARII